MRYIDSAMVGALGANASASIGLVSTSTWLIGGIIGGVSAGFSCRRRTASAGDDRGAHRCAARPCDRNADRGDPAALAALISEPLRAWLHGDEAIQLTRARIS